MGSGARVIPFDRFAVKIGNERVGEQGTWLLQHRDIVCLPAVVAVWYNGYVMEGLRDVPNEPGYLSLLPMLLEEQVWCRPAEVEMNWQKHAAYAAHRCPLPFIEKYGEMLATVMSLDLRACLTHGDPTLDNLMMRPQAAPDDRYVLSDPIPAKPHAPDLMALDLGKILQSAYGYEAVMWGEDPARQPEPRALTAALHDEYGDDEAYAARFFCAFHYIRLLPYMPSQAMRDRMEVLLARVLGL